MLKRFCAALGFLTILPLPGWCSATEEELPKSVPYFPLIGLLAGGVIGGGVFLTSAMLPQLVAGVIYLILLAVVHGGLHLDGLADTGDGFFSHRTRERILEIMSDARMGAYGCVTLVSVLGLKLSGLLSIPASSLPYAIILAATAGRCMMVLMLVLLPSARETGLGVLFKRGRSLVEAAWALSFFLGVAWFLFDWKGLVTVGAVLAMTSAFMWLCMRKINGFTGDTLGALSEVSEAVTLVTASILLLR